MVTIYAGSINQYKFNYQTVFPSRFHRQDDDGLMLE